MQKPKEIKMEFAHVEITAHGANLLAQAVKAFTDAQERKANMLEDLAALAHEQWSGWMEYLFEKSTDNPDGTVTIPAWAVERWKRQVATPYDQLSEQEQESDRNEARRVIEILNRERDNLHD